MFEKILIANRGEIVCRVIRTAKRLGIATVAVYSDADAGALHVEMADEAVRIGPPPAAQSYLSIEAILAAIRQTGADAVHPGYGFLSEREAFVEALERAGVAFIGPTAKAIAAMGDKIESKKLAKAAGVSTVPGYLGVIADAAEAVKIARDIGYPVMIKASAGGGGKGMRIAHNDAETKEGFARATSEARSSFGDDRVFIEKFIEQPRHIEIQVLADAHGTALYLGERECSIQRRHQKVVEEAPSPFLDSATRRAMGEQAVALARAVGYRSAGTVEFIVDPKRNFYFLEMNTRLQVEHPVTEMVTGFDLVEQMIRVAAGERLGLAQADVRLLGWAIETRLYAEDPLRGFLPSIGRLVKFRPPAESGSVRIDTGVTEGSEISRFYDPMIAKLVTYGPDRRQAVRRMADALDRFYVRGINHNIAFLRAVMDVPRFERGEIDTGFIDDVYPEGFGGVVLPPERLRLGAAIAAAIAARTDRLASGAVIDAVATLGEHRLAVAGRVSPGGVDVRVDRQEWRLESAWRPGEVLFEGSANGAPVAAQVDVLAEGVRLTLDGAVSSIVLRRARIADLAGYMPVKVPPDLSKFLLSPMPGLVVSIAVKDGQTVEAGEALAVIDAMKMENVLTAERRATIKAVKAKAGDSLAVDQVILEFE
ncbi:MAG: acetyl/propionyl/methylcrotonyl-CoA carboxylase subunit alpha [Alphaproteobacteria bacterium]|nr:acetyl/propionyl/methylcrotonyl-CoA carboxylase subunit alpha [Alphaproteobacteria bacterium]